MRPVYQTLPAPEGKGNCLQACIASILELPLVAVPHFALWYDDPNWHERLNDWLIENANVYMLSIQANSMYLDAPRGYALLGGLSPRGLMHSVVILDGEMVHDPHPDGGGIVEPEAYSIFVSLMKGDDK